MATKQRLGYPIFADPDRRIAVALGMLNQDHMDAKGLPLTVRRVFIVGPNRRIKLTLTYPASTGRNFDEIVRCLKSLQLTYKDSIATPANWKVGDPVVCLPSLKTEDATKKFGSVRQLDLPSGKPYMRYVEM